MDIFNDISKTIPEFMTHIFLVHINMQASILSKERNIDNPEFGQRKVKSGEELFQP
jgi:hypothetical protein